MNHESAFPGDLPAAEMAEYLRLYLDETGEQLDALVDTLLRLEADPADGAGLNEAFRLIHSIKGSSALLGLDRITTLTHHLESHFERLRSGRRVLDASVMSVVLKCIDFLKGCNERLRRGEPLDGAGDLLEQVKGLEHSAVASDAAAAPGASPEPEAVGADVAADVAFWRITVRFAPALPMAEMKAELILTRLEQIGAVLDLQPPRSGMQESAGLERFEVVVRTAADRDRLASACRPDGVMDAILEVVDADTRARPAEHAAFAAAAGEAAVVADDTGIDRHVVDAHEPAASRGGHREAAGGRSSAGLGETVRVDVDRLDVLLNLAGELVVNRARLTQLSAEMAPAFGKTSMAGRTQAVIDALEQARGSAGPAVGASVDDAIAQIDVLHQQARLWDEARRRFTELTAAVDQLGRVSNSLQRGVLNTRMVPVGPLFNRFRRIVRDIALELGKRVHLELVGEKTELDKRMIDEIGDPLNHLIRNSIDHGIEPVDARIRRGKPETATLRLSAVHRGNNVFITIEDDGGGIDTARVGQIAVERGLLTADTVASLGERDLIELIWQPGFSTARTVSDISGRGVGMDIVRTRIAALNGSIDVESTPGVGARFTIRLPLTLTITRCMLFRIPQGVVAVPMENIREIVAAHGHDRVRVNGGEVMDIRGEMLPLLAAGDLFSWTGPAGARTGDEGAVVILTANKRSLGLRVTDLLGSQDLVIKPLDEQFAHVRGLGGASILGDGAVCLLLDVAQCLDRVQRSSGSVAASPAS